MGNDALRINGFTNTVTVNNHITTRGSDWYWTVSAVMLASTLVFIGLAFTKRRTARLLHYITAAMTFIAGIAYFSMASNLGWTGIRVEFERGSPKEAGNIRQIFYVRYIDWFLTSPLLLLDLFLTCGFPTSTIWYTILIEEIVVVTGLVGALVHSSYKWGYFVFGFVALLFVAFTVVFEGRINARELGADVSRAYTICSVWTVGLWLLYPIAWGVSEGGNVIPADSEAVFYGVLDILSKPVFGALLLWGHRNIDPARLGLESGNADRLPRSVVANEKPANATNGATTNDTVPAATV